MKLLRTGFAAALFLLMALPSAAAVRRTPAVDGPQPASIEGMISSVNLPVVTLLGGLVSFDASGATVRFSNGTEGTAGDLEPGQRIIAFVDPASSPLLAGSIVVMEQREDVALTGTVEAIDTEVPSLKVLGFTVKVTGKTVFGGPWDGVGHGGLEDIAVGDLVLVMAMAGAGDLVAVRVMELGPSPMPTVRLHGVVESIGTESWTITVAEGELKVLKVDARTRIIGEPKVGDEVDVIARPQADGSLLAILIHISEHVPSLPTERYSGIVKAIEPSLWTIGPADGATPDRLFTVDEKTKILGDPVVGDPVGVLARELEDGSFLALVIAEVFAAPPVAEVAFDGVVVSLPPGGGSGPGATVPIGTWIVDETRVIVSRATIVTGAPKVGDRVHVEGLDGHGGSVLAKVVEKI